MWKNSHAGTAYCSNSSNYLLRGTTARMHSDAPNFDCDWWWVYLNSDRRLTVCLKFALVIGVDDRSTDKSGIGGGGLFSFRQEDNHRSGHQVGESDLVCVLMHNGRCEKMKANDPSKVCEWQS